MGEVADILDLLIGFEQDNKVNVEIHLASVRTEGKWDIAVSATAHDLGYEIGAVPPLASASVTCLVTGLRNLRDVVTRALYVLDGQLALQEFDKLTTKKA